MAKSIAKSVRMTQEVYDFIENFEDKDNTQNIGFNQKFEDLVLFYQKEEPKKKSQIKILDKEIIQKQEQLAKQNKAISANSQVLSLFDTAKYQLESLQKQSETLTQKLKGGQEK